MIAIKKILFPTDFSECAKSAREYAVALTGQFHAELHILHVLADPVMMMPEPGYTLSLSPNYLVEMKQEAQRAVDKVLPEGSIPGLAVVRSLRMGNPFAEIVKYAGEADIDLIVIGTRGRSGLVHLLLGSVAEKVVRKAQCPVLTVRPAGHQFVMTS